MSFLGTVPVERPEMDITAEFPADGYRIVCTVAVQDDDLVTPVQPGERAPDIPAFVMGDDNGAHRQPGW